jgi:hypothetical protein
MRGHSSSAREEWPAFFGFNAFPRVFSLTAFILTQKKTKVGPSPLSAKGGAGFGMTISIPSIPLGS